MDWPEILEYQPLIKKIVAKYCRNTSLAQDIEQEVLLSLHLDKNLDSSKFDPNKKMSAVASTIRNKVFRALRDSGETAYYQRIRSLDSLENSGIQVNTEGELVFPEVAKDSSYSEREFLYPNLEALPEEFTNRIEEWVDQLDKAV